jgi:hypothetical protein
VKFTILAPEQIAAVRGAGRGRVDQGRPRHGRHGAGVHLVAPRRFGPAHRHRRVRRADLARRGLRRRIGSAEALLKAVEASAARSRSKESRLVLCASDGELWGHHKKFADLTLAYATHDGASAGHRGARTSPRTSERHPPDWEIDLVPGPNGEGTAWSCAHGLGRWQRDCGCNFNTAAGWNQKWRVPLRQALGPRARRRRAFYEDAASELLVDPWGARDAYGDAVDARSRSAIARSPSSRRPRCSRAARPRAIARACCSSCQRATLLMYASCGWFFDDVAGLEGSLVIRMAAHALDLLEQAGGGAPPTRRRAGDLGRGEEQPRGGGHGRRRLRAR